MTIMNDPELLILDEPTKGFDPVNRRLLMDIIADQKHAGATVIMVTHQMEEVERLCDRVILLKDGTAEAYGTIAEVQNKFGGRIFRLTAQRRPPALAPLRRRCPGDELRRALHHRRHRRSRRPAGTHRRRRGRPELHHHQDVPGRDLHQGLRRPEQSLPTPDQAATALPAPHRPPPRDGRSALAQQATTSAPSSRFEFIRTVKKRRFWIATLAIPVIMAIVFGLIFLSNSTTDTAADAQKKRPVTITYTDASGLITPRDRHRHRAAAAGSPDAGIQAVQSGAMDAYFAYPAEPERRPSRVYGRTRGSSRTASTTPSPEHATTPRPRQIGSPQLSALAAGAREDRDLHLGRPPRSGGIGSVVPPLMFLLIFYV